MGIIYNFIISLFRVFYEINKNDSCDELIPIFQQYSKYFTIGDPVRDVLRTLGFGLIRIMDQLTTALLTVLGKVYRIITFDTWLYDYQNPSQNQIGGTVLERLGFGQIGGYLAYIIPIALVITGIILMIGSNEIKGSKVLKNIALGIFVIMILPGSIKIMGDLTMSFYDDNNTTIEEQARSQADNFIYDVEWIFTGAENLGSEFEQRLKNKNDINDTYILMIDINERINPIGDDNAYYTRTIVSEGGTMFTFRLMVRPNGNTSAVTTSRIKVSALPDSFKGYYYRFYFDFIPLFLLYLAYIIVIVFTIVRCIRLAYEIVINHLVVLFLASTDFLSGKKLKEALLYLFYTFITLMYAVVAIVLFSKFISFASASGADMLSLSTLGDFAGIAEALIIFVVALAVIDGPALMQKITGIDAGLKDGYNTFDRLMRIGRSGSRIAKSAAGTVKGAARGIQAVGNATGITASSRKGTSNKPETPQQKAAKEQRAAAEAFANRDKNTEKDIDIKKSGSVNGKPTSTMKDVANSMNNADSDIVAGSFKMKRNADAMKDSDRDSSLDEINVPFLHRPNGSQSGQQTIQSAMQKAAEENGVNLKDYHFDGSEAQMKGSNIQFGKPGNSELFTGFTKTGEKKPAPKGQPAKEPQATKPSGPSGNRPSPQRGTGTNQTGLGLSNKRKGTETPSETRPTERKTPSETIPSGSQSPTQAPSGVESQNLPGSQWNNGGASQNEVHSGLNSINAETGTLNAGSPEASSSGLGESIAGVNINQPTETSGNIASAPIPEQAPSPSQYTDPVADYNANAGSYQALRMEPPVEANQTSYADAAYSAIKNNGGIDSDGSFYTQIKMVNGSDLNMQPTFETIGFNSTANNYKKTFNQTITKWKKTNEQNKHARVSEVQVFKKTVPQKKN